MKKNILGIICLVVLTFSHVAADSGSGWDLIYREGVVGECAEGRSKFSADIISPLSGTIQCWIKLNKKSTEMTYNHLWGIGFNQIGWFTSYISKGEFVVTCRSEDGSSSVRIDISNWKVDEWHNIAVCWGKYQSKSIILIYEDGNLKAKRNKVCMPLEFNSKLLCVGFNSASFKGDNFAGEIDELLISNLPLTPKEVKDNVAKGENKEALVLKEGTILLVDFDGNANGKSDIAKVLEGKSLKKYLRKALKNLLVKKYANQIDTEYSYNIDIKEKTPKILTDGSDKSMIIWKNHPLEVIFELPYSADLSLIEIATPKPTIWYRLESIEIFLDNGSGEFSTPKIIKTYGEAVTQKENVVDKTCKTYLYKWDKPGKACRVKIVPKGKGYMALGEVRICGKPAK